MFLAAVVTALVIWIIVTRVAVAVIRVVSMAVVVVDSVKVAQGIPD